jgi:iron complex transport system ATP-binding protein
LQYADQVLVMKQGKAFASGIPQKVLTPENIKECFGLSVHLIQPEQTHYPIIVSDITNSGLPDYDHHKRNHITTLNNNSL